MTDWVVNLIDAGGYWGIALLMALENIFPPLPSELIMSIGVIVALLIARGLDDRQRTTLAA